MPRKFTLQLKETLPPLTPKQVQDLITFCAVNASRLAVLVDYESCCCSDDIETIQSFVYDALRIGYDITDLDTYIEERIG